MAIQPAVSSDPSPQGDSLALMLADIVRGESDALARLYDATSRNIYGLVLRITGDASVAEEITLDVYLQVWRTSGSYDPSRGSALAWLATIARSRSIDWLRSRRNLNRKVEGPLEERSFLQQSGPGPELAVLEDERSRAVRRAIVQLRPEEREVIELAYFQGFSHSEIASETGLPLGTVKSRIRRAFGCLRDALGMCLEAL